MYGEGLQLPPTKLWSDGEPRQDIIDIILENSRIPRQLRADLRAHRASSRVGVEQLSALVSEYGTATYRRYTESLIERTERTMREAIRDLPDERVQFAEQLDGFDDPLTINATLTVADDEIIVDFDGTAAQQDGVAINCPANYTYAFVLIGIKAALDPETPPAHGMTLPIEMRAPDGCLINPTPPVPVGSRQVLADFVLSVVNGSLAQLIPDKVPASGSQLHWEVMEFSDPDPRQQSILQDGFYGGGGGAPTHDGEPAISGATNVKNVPVEALENDFPLRIRRYEIVPGTAGAGHTRGGNSTIREYEFLQDTTVQCVNERFLSGPPGVAGGRRGQAGSATLLTDEGEKQIRSKEQFRATKGDRLWIRTAAGGGHGEPAHRSRDAVVEDVLEGLLTRDDAATEYDVRDLPEGEP
jgi:N-methylhydantoinase B